MFNTIAKWSLLFSALIGIQALVSFVVHPKIISASIEFFRYIWLLDGFLPVQIMFDCLLSILLFHLVKLVFNILFGFIGMFSGSGHPQA